MEKRPVWDPFEDWKHADIRWVKPEVAKEDFKRFYEKSNLKGFIQMFLFLLMIGTTGFLSFYFFHQRMWIPMAVCLYFHGMIYPHFGDGMHELVHSTVFRSQFLNKAVLWMFGILYWPYNPFLYRLSHLHYHHRYTLHQNSDGEDVPNYVDLNAKSLFLLFFRVLHIKNLVQCLGRLLTLKPVSNLWRMRGYPLDRWEQFILEKANDKERKAVHRFTVVSLVFHALFVAACIVTGQWFLIFLITLAPFYGPKVHGYVCGILQHACCEANDPDLRNACNSVKLDPVSSVLYWHMEYHTEHHLFASVPCYNLKKFNRYLSDQMPATERAVPKLLQLAKRSPARFGSLAQWREDYGRFKGF